MSLERSGSQSITVIMAPSVTMNIESDFVTPKPRSFDSLSPSRSLLLSPPSLSSHPEKLNKILAAYDRAYTDIQMLDRLSLSLVSLPDSTYDNILILLDADGTRRESEKLLNRDVFCHIAKALKPNGRLKSQDGTFALTDTVERREAIFAGLLIDKNEMAKPGHEATQSVPLRFGKTQGEHGATASSQTASTTDLPLNKNGKRTSELSDATPLSGVDFVEFGDDLDDAIEESDNEELIDEDTLLNDEDLTRPIIQRMSLLRFSSLFLPLSFVHINLSTPI